MTERTTEKQKSNDKTVGDVIKGETSTGFKYTIPRENLDNYELLEAISEVDANPLIVPKVVRLLFGENADRLKDHVRTESGIVPAQQMGEEIKEIFENVQVKK